VTADELKSKRIVAGARYAELALELLNVRVEIQSLEHILASPIANGHGEPGGFNADADINDLPRLLAHKTFSPHLTRQPSGEVIKRVNELAKLLRAAAT
jgi:hypothetical protein